MSAQSRSELALGYATFCNSGCMKICEQGLPEEKARSYLSRISYGNMDPSTKGGAYWVDGKLAIPAGRAGGFFKKLYQNDLPFELDINVF